MEPKWSYSTCLPALHYFTPATILIMQAERIAENEEITAHFLIEIRQKNDNKVKYECLIMACKIII